VENLEIGFPGAGTMEIAHRASTNKICRCVVKGHLISECTVTVFCEICRSNDHAMCRCPVLKQPKPVVQLVGCTCWLPYSTYSDSAGKERF
jgi:hypothetical protein